MRALVAASCTAAIAGCSPVCATDADCGGALVCSDTRCIPKVDRPHLDRTDGWDAPPGEGQGYILTSVQIAPAELGFDLDGRCENDFCIDNLLDVFGPQVNDGIAGGLAANLGRTAVEIAGIDEPFFGDDARVTLKTYEAMEESDPPACCRFSVSRRSVAGDPFRARWRAPARYAGGTARHAGIGLLAIALPLRRGTALFELHRPAFEVTSPTELAPRISILLGGAIRARDLATVPNPFCTGAVNGFCRASESTMLDFLVDRGRQPDIDLDEDGLEGFEVDARGRLSACYDGCSADCPSALPVAPLDGTSPPTCAARDQIADGYSVTFVLVGAPATLVGVR